MFAWQSKLKSNLHEIVRVVSTWVSLIILVHLMALLVTLLMVVRMRIHVQTCRNDRARRHVTSYIMRVITVHLRAILLS